MAAKTPTRLALGEYLTRRGMTVAELARRMERDGGRFDVKTIYRLAKDQPVRNLNLPVLAAVGRALKLHDPGKLIVWSHRPARPPRLRRISAEVQNRLDRLMAKNNEGALNAAERQEFEELGRTVEELSLENARLLAGHVATATTSPVKTGRAAARRSSTAPRLSSAKTAAGR